MILLLPQGRDQTRVGTREVSLRSERVRQVDGTFPATVCEADEERFKEGNAGSQ